METPSDKPEGHRERDIYQKKGTIGQWTSIKDNFPPCQKFPVVTTEQLKQHNTIDDLWTVVRGTVYDITDYAYYHPGGAEELLRGAGRDCTDLFLEYHPWIAEKAYMSRNQEVGKSLGTGKEDNVKFISAKAISIEKYNYNTNIYQFQLETPYELKEGQHIKFIGGSGQPIMRSYTPISPIHQSSVFEFIIKLYDTGKMSRYLKKFKVGDKIKIKSTTNKYYRPKTVNKIGMIAAGTGIAPMMQIIQKVIKDGSDIEMVLLFSNVLEEDILLKERLEELQKKAKNLTVHYTLTNPKDSWTGLRGRIDKAKIQELLPAPRYFVRHISINQLSDISKVNSSLMCGPIAMTNAMELILNDVGHSDSMIHLFL